MLGDLGPQVYRCIQGVLFVKRSEEPTHEVIMKLRRPLGTFVYSTGYLWRGLSGGIWAEFDAQKGEMGWVLVKGPGFDLDGPALIDATAESFQGAVSLAVESLGKTALKSKAIFETFIDKESPISYVKHLLCEATGLNSQFVCLSKDKPGKMADASGGKDYLLPASFMQPLDGQVRLSSFGGDHVQLYLVYTGDFNEDYFGEEPPEPQSDKGESQQPAQAAWYASYTEDTTYGYASYPRDSSPPRGYNGYAASSFGYQSGVHDTESEDEESMPPKPVPVQVQPRFPCSHAVWSSPGMAPPPHVPPDVAPPSREARQRKAALVTEITLQGGVGEEYEVYGGTGPLRFVGQSPDAISLPFGGPLTQFGEGFSNRMDYDDDEVQFGPPVDPMDIPDFGYGTEIEWIDAD